MLDGLKTEALSRRDHLCNVSCDVFVRRRHIHGTSCGTVKLGLGTVAHS